MTQRGRLWTATHGRAQRPVPRRGALLVAIEPLRSRSAVLALVHAWAIPELYAKRGANVRAPARRGGADGAERTRARAAGRPRRPRGARPARADRAGARARARSASGSWGRPARCSCARAGGACTAAACASRTRDAAQRRPDRAPAARAARGRGGLRHGGQPGLQRRALARARGGWPRRCARRWTPPARIAQRSSAARLNASCQRSMSNRRAARRMISSMTVPLLLRRLVPRARRAPPPPPARRVRRIRRCAATGWPALRLEAARRRPRALRAPQARHD